MKGVLEWSFHGNLCRTIGPLLSQRFPLASAKAQPRGGFVNSKCLVTPRHRSNDHGGKKFVLQYKSEFTMIMQNIHHSTLSLNLDRMAEICFLDHYMYNGMNGEHLHWPLSCGSLSNGVTFMILSPYSSRSCPGSRAFTRAQSSSWTCSSPGTHNSRPVNQEFSSLCDLSRSPAM